MCWLLSCKLVGRAGIQTGGGANERRNRRTDGPTNEREIGRLCGAAAGCGVCRVRLGSVRKNEFASLRQIVAGLNERMAAEQFLVPCRHRHPAALPSDSPICSCCSRSCTRTSVGPTNRPTDRPTDRGSERVQSGRLWPFCMSCPYQ